MQKLRNIFLISVFLILVQAQFGSSGDSCCSLNQIQVVGKGKVSAQPDIANIRIRFNEQGKTSAEAVTALSAKVNQAVTVLKANGYNSDSYETQSLQVYPKYDYTDGNSRVVGQQAQQSLKITVKNLDAKGQKVATLVDALSSINSINIDSVSFDIFDKSPLQTQARAAAFKDAKEKAQDYAGLAGLSLGRLLTIDDLSYVESPPVSFRGDFKLAASAAPSSTSVPVGEQDLSYSVTITYGLR